MFIKLSFSANTRLSKVLRILTDIINTNTITSVSALQSRFTSASYHSTLTSDFDAANSTIIRTVDPTTTKAVIGSNADYVSYGYINFVLEQEVYDNSASKIYTQLRHNGSNAVGYMDVGTAITGGTMSSASILLTRAETYSGTDGTNLTLGGNNFGLTNYTFDTGKAHDNIRTFWAYITNRCFYWAATVGTSYNSGFGSTYNDPTKFCGPFFQTQYTRYDYHNTDSNGIYPALYTCQRNAGIGYGTSNDLTTVQNLNYTTSSATLPLRVNSVVSALPQIGTAWPKIYNQPVNMTVAGRTSAVYGLNQIQVLGTATSATTASYAGAFSTAASTRYPNATLTATGFGLMPFGWEANFIGNHGGNATDKSGVYIFNGDYVPGDTFIYNNKTYMVWPMHNGYSQRVGFAVPME